MDMVTGRNDAAGRGRPPRRFTGRSATNTLVILILNGCIAGSAWAQKDWDFQPRLAVSEIYTDNVRLAPDGQEDDEFITEITPGFTLSRQSSRLKLAANYRMQTLTFLDDSDGNRVNHKLDGNMNAELREDLLYLDARAFMTQALVDPRGPRPSSSITGSGNIADARGLSISPYLRHNFANYVTGLLRYGYQVVDTDGAVETSETNSVDAELKSGRHFGPLSWDLNYHKSEADRGRSSDFNQESSTANLAYRVIPELALLAQAGREDNEFESTRVPQNGSYWGVGANWRPSRYISLTALEGDKFTSGTVVLTPSVRTSLDVTYRERDVGLNPGSVWSGAFKHRTRRSTWSLNYYEDTTTTQRLFSSQEQLLDTLSQLSGTEVTEADLSDFIDLLNLFPPELQAVYEDALFLASLGQKEEVFERKRAQGAVNYKTGKSVLGLSVFAEKRDYLNPIGSILQSDVVEDQQSRGAQASWLWKFSGRSRSLLRAYWDRTEFDSDNREDDFWYVDATVTRELSSRARASIGYRHTRRDSSDPNAGYDENRLTARFSMDF